jgi:hypothetical protein
LRRKGDLQEGSVVDENSIFFAKTQHIRVSGATEVCKAVKLEKAQFI